MPEWILKRFEFASASLSLVDIVAISPLHHRTWWSEHGERRDKKQLAPRDPPFPSFLTFVYHQNFHNINHTPKFLKMKVVSECKACVAEWAADRKVKQAEKRKARVMKAVEEERREKKAGVWKGYVLI